MLAQLWDPPLICLGQCFSNFFEAWHFFTNRNFRGTPPNENVIKLPSEAFNTVYNDSVVLHIFMLTQCETWACLLEHKADILTGIEEGYTRSSSSSTLSLSSFFKVFITVKVEKLSSYRYVVGKGSNVEIALFARMGTPRQLSTKNCPKVDLQSSA